MFPDSKVHGANMGPTWVLSAPDGPHVGPQEPCYNALSLLLVLTEWIYYVGRRNPRLQQGRISITCNIVIVKNDWPCKYISDLGQQKLCWWLVTWWHPAITWTNVALSSKVLCGISLGTSVHKIPMNLIRGMCSTIIYIYIYVCVFGNYCHITQGTRKVQRWRH